jgi:hypothetical protein
MKFMAATEMNPYRGAPI